MIRRRLQRSFSAGRGSAARRRNAAIAEAIEARVLLSGATAAFVRADTATQGSWGGVYGAEGSDVFTQSPNLPSYAQVSVANAQTYVWDNSTTDVRELQTTAGAATRTAACDYAAGAFTINVNLTDGNAHQVGLYVLDWDRQGRSESVQVADTGTGTLLDTRAVSGIGNGEWLLWNLSGQVTITVTNTGPVNAVASGLVFDPAPAASGASASFVASDASTAGSWAGKYGADGYSVLGGTTSLPAYATLSTSNASAWTWASSTTDARAPLSAPNGSSRVAACDYAGTSFTLDVNLTDGKSHQVALYLLDWDGLGRAETVTVADAGSGTVLDTRAAANFQGGQWLSWTLSGHVKITLTSTAGQNAVLSAVAFDPVPASTNPGSATFVRADASTQGTWPGHYGADGYALPGIGAALPSYATLAGTPGTQMYTWASGTNDPRAVQVSPTISVRTAACDFSATTFGYDLNLSDGKAHQVALYLLDWDSQGRSETVTVADAATGTVLDTQNASNFSGGEYLVWNLSGHVRIAITRTGGQNAVASGLLFGPIPGTTPATASFVRSDATTEGTWVATYGADGYSLFNGPTSLPRYAQVSAGPGTTSYAWTSTTTDARALQVPGSSSRLAACDYPASGNTFSLDLNLSDGQAHQVALYMMDWDARGRAQTVQLSDANSGAVLDTRSVSNFASGQWLVWTVSGHVRITLTSTSGLNPVASGVFFARASNQAFWINPAGGYWDVASNWQGGVLPGPNDDVFINQPNNPTITFRTGSATVHSVTASDPVSLAGGSLTVGGVLQATGGFSLDGGNLVGATVSAATQISATKLNAISTLDGIEVDGDLAVAGVGGVIASVRIVNGLVLNGTIHLGNGGTPGSVLFGNDVSVPGSILGTGSVILSGTPSNALVNNSSAAGAGTLTIGPGILVHGGGGSIYNTLNNGEGIVNQGRIDADVRGDTIQIGNGESSLIPTRFINTGTLVASSGNIEIEGTLKTADLGTFTSSGGTFYLFGTLDNSGATLRLDAATGTLSLMGAIKNGVISEFDGIRLYTQFGTLDGVTVNGDLAVYNLWVFGGLTLNGTMYVGPADGSLAGSVYFGDNTHASGSLMGTGSVVFGGSASNVLANASQVSGANTTLAIGSGITIHGAKGSIANSYAGDALINQGTILSDMLAGVVTVGSVYGSVTNAGTFGTSNGGDLEIQGSFTTGSFGKLAQSGGGVVGLTGSLDNTGSVLNLDGSSGSLRLNGTLKGGTVNESGGALLIPQNATLDGVILNGDLNASLGAAVVRVLDGITLNGTLEAGSADGSTFAAIYFGQAGASPFSLAGVAAVVFGGSSLNSIANDTTLSGVAGTLTFAPSVSIRGKNGRIVDTMSVGSLSMQGSVVSDTAGGTLLVDDGNGPLTNAGTMQAINGGSLTVTNLADANGLSITGGGTLTLNGQWANSGTITASNSTLNLGGAFTYVAMGTINRTGGTVNLTGTLLNANNTLSLDPTTGSWNLATGGAIDDGTITTSGGAILNPMGGTLSNVTLASNLTVTNGQSLTIANGMTLDATLQLESTGAATDVYFLGTETIAAGAAGAQVVLHGTGSALLLRGRAAPMTLTVGPGMTIHGQGAIATDGTPATTLVNQGVIIADVVSQLLSLTPTVLTNASTGQLNVAGGWMKVGGAWSNTAGGTLAIGSGTLELSGTFTTASARTVQRTGGAIQISGVLDNAQDSFSVGASTGSILLSGTIKNGTVVESNGAALLCSAGTLDGVTLQGDLKLNLLTQSAVTILDGLVLNGTAYVGDSSANNITGILNFGKSQANAPQTLSGSGTILFGASTTQDQLNNYASTLTLGAGIFIHGQNGTILNESTSNTIIDQGAFSADSTAQGSISVRLGTITLSGGTLSASNSGFVQFSSTLVNDGTINVPPLGSFAAIAINGNYVQGAAGAMNVVLNDSTNTVLPIGGSATLGGTLNVALASGFVPAVGRAFNILSGGSVSGTFANIVDQNPGDGIGFSPVYGPNYLTLVTVAGG